MDSSFDIVKEAYNFSKSVKICVNLWINSLDSDKMSYSNWRIYDRRIRNECR